MVEFRDDRPDRAGLGLRSDFVATNRLYYGDNLDILRQHVADSSVDLIYLDPPFNSDASYNLLFSAQDGSRPAAQIKAFQDTWRWDQAAVRSFEELIECGGDVAAAMRAFRTFLPESNMLAYLAMMAPRLVELRSKLKDSGSIYLHCDPTASHYLKMLMDAIFGAKQFLNEIIWYYRGAGVPKTAWARRHDVILWYAKKDGQQYFNPDPVRREYAAATKDRFSHTINNVRGGVDFGPQQLNPLGKHPDDVFTHIQPIAPSAKVRLGYPTQKPESLLAELIKSSCPPGGVVMDPFCGCGTTISAAQELGHEWIGIDVTHLAINLIKYRLQDAFGAEINNSYTVIGEPASSEDAAVLAAADPYQFQFWSLGLVGARPIEEKKGADRGIDGRLYFHDEPVGGQTKQVIFSVKAGKVGVAAVRDLRGVLDREEAQMGVLISLNAPTSNMRAEAASVGTYRSPWGKHPRIQLVTVDELLDGARIDMPPVGSQYKVRAAPRKPKEMTAQASLLE